MGYNLGEAVKAARLSKKLTQKQLGQLARLEASSICKIERGNSFPSIDSLRELTIALDTSADILLGIPQKQGMPYNLFDEMMEKVYGVQEEFDRLNQYYEMMRRDGQHEDSDL